MLNNNYFLSICIPTFNRCNKLSKTIDNLLCQIKRCSVSVELIISDNFSTDQTSFIVESYLNDFNFIRYIKNQSNIGLVLNVVSCFKNSSGNFVWVVGDDDKIENFALDELVELLKSNPEISLLHLNYSIINGRNSLIEEHSYYSKFLLEKDFYTLNDMISDQNRIDGFMAISCNIVKKDIILEAIKSWMPPHPFLAYPLYLYLYCGLKSVALCKKPVLSLVYYTTSWSSYSSIVYNIQIPRVLILLKKYNLNQMVIDNYFYRFYKFDTNKDLIFIFLKKPYLFFIYIINIINYLLIKKCPKVLV